MDSREGDAGNEEQLFLHSSAVPDPIVVEKAGGSGGGKGAGGSGSSFGASSSRSFGWHRFMAGWRAGVGLNVLVAFAVLIAGFVCLIVAISRTSLEEGRLAIFVGSCATARRVDLGVHAVVNVLVVVLLAGGNYVFQVLSSPTREEVSAAHRGRRWLDIGVPSVRNLGRVDRGRMLLAVVVLGAAVLTQVL